MEKITWHRANFDYEYDLFDISLDTSKRIQACSEFEYLYLFMNGGPSFGLVLHKELDEQYISDCPFPCPTQKIEPKKLLSYVNCWGKLENIQKERELNSKTYSLVVEDRLNINRSNKELLNSPLDYQSYQMRYPGISKIIQSPYLFSGIGQRLIDDNSEQPKDFPLIISHKLNRICDFGTVVRRDEANLLYICLNNSSGKYRGSVYFKSESALSLFLTSHYLIPIDDIVELLKELKCVTSLLEKEFSEVDSFQFDSFIYKDTGTFALYPLVEINYRKTLGILFNEILTNQSEMHFARLVPSRLNRISRDGVSKISPVGSRFDVYLGEADTVDDLVDHLKSFESIDAL